jgi:hypothetical protein
VFPPRAEAQQLLTAAQQKVVIDVVENGQRVSAIDCYAVPVNRSSKGQEESRFVFSLLLR